LKVNLKSEKHIVAELIDGFSGVANSQNMGASKTDNDIAQGIGKLLLSHTNLVEDFKPLVNREHCAKGMQEYLHTFEGGTLVKLAEEVGDNGQYINQVRLKFNADAANWVWNLDTAEQKIREVILEYRIIVASNKVLPLVNDTVNKMDSGDCGNILLFNQDFLCDIKKWITEYNPQKANEFFIDACKHFSDEVNSSGKHWIVVKALLLEEISADLLMLFVTDASKEEYIDLLLNASLNFLEKEFKNDEFI
jgi:hypothetical protein